jgi:hypothetical protein
MSVRNAALGSAVVFAGRNGLDFIEVRSAVVRIPEVSIRLREAQALIDSLEIPHVDLWAHLASDDDVFFRNIKLKSLLAAVVQVGLFDRFQRTQRPAQFIVGASNGDSSLLVCAGLISFEEMVMQSQAVESLRPKPSVVVPMLGLVNSMPGFDDGIILPESTTTTLAGMSLTEYRAVELRSARVPSENVGSVEATSAYTIVETTDSIMDLKKLLQHLYNESGVTRFISVGPSSGMRWSDFAAMGAEDVEALDSIELDPMLSWFWASVRPPMAVAQ